MKCSFNINDLSWGFGFQRFQRFFQHYLFLLACLAILLLYSFPRMLRLLPSFILSCPNITPYCLFVLAALSPSSVLSVQKLRLLLTPCRSRGCRQPLVYLKLILGTHRMIRLAFLQCAKVKVRELSG